MGHYLDVNSVEAFIKVEELNSFTLAAEALCLTQAGVTLKIQKLERMLGFLLFHRTPRRIYLSAEGELFLPRAKALLAAHDSALMPLDNFMLKREVSLGVSDFIVDVHFVEAIARIRKKHPDLILKLQVDASSIIFNEYEKKNLDLAILTQDCDKKYSCFLWKEAYGWYGKADIKYNRDLVPLVTLRESCRLRKTAIDSFKINTINWYDSFIGNSITENLNAIQYGLGISPMPHRIIKSTDNHELVEVSKKLNLPALPSANVVMQNNKFDSYVREIMHELTESFNTMRYLSDVKEEQESHDSELNIFSLTVS
ncbi:LysR family regulatory protein [Azotobacter vinelandii CA]|uniref:Bacterial regulatory protein, LysR family n=2 Tax=Azotobacter vinelandii TaxID=354 RepID=C1DEY3_AZOVD|nr:LysR family transcriptional regulator [Azotobacter vinelandii]ACO80312.1 Bacterial regulatory protein, LysR family [Azotobacter vinelandii DJ]AGK14428.1 LysR family regulatory protein [Azotobacter vinelandii CA]AGK21838.1 LysR family regulatory protein [Azotobacter vinelandii CA6]SFY15144.1 DNA-binding transcriptional regulator, LysR family [Azotobacter vinelandii]GLK58272.1 hypothetical protein GCM10017624_04290 [Azotobacter vinelandii]